MAQRLNKKLVVGLTVAGMLVIFGAGVLLVLNLPGRDPKPVVDKAETLVAEATKLEQQIKQVDGQLTDSSDDSKRAELRKEREKLQDELHDKYETASKYYAKASNRASTAGDPASAANYMVKAGELALSMGDQRLAGECWRRVLLNNPKHEAAQQKVVALLLEQADLYGRDLWKELRNQAELLVADDFAPNNVVGLHALGRALIESPTSSLDDLKRGGEYLQKAYQLDKSNPKVADSLAMYYMRSLERQIVDARKNLKNDLVVQLESQREETAEKGVKVYDELIATLDRTPTADNELKTLAWRKKGQYHMAVRDAAQAELQSKMRNRAPQTETTRIQDRIADHAKMSMQCFEKALAISPKDVDSLVLMGVHWRSSMPAAADPAAQQKEVDANFLKAKDLFVRAIKADPDGFDGYIELQSIYVRDASSAFGSRDKTGLISNIQKASQVLQERIDRGAARTGIYQYRNKMYMGVVRWQLFQINSWLVERLRGLAGNNQAAEADTKPILTQLGRIRADYAAETSAGEKDPRAMFMKARIEMLGGKTAEAIKVFREVQDLVSQGDLWIQVKIYLAQLYSQTDQPGLAVESLQAVLKLAPNHDPALGMLAQAMASLPDRQSEAEEVAKRALAINPSNNEAITALAGIYEKQKNWRELERIQKDLRGTRKSSDADLLDASLLLTRSNDPDNRDPDLVTNAQAKLRAVLQENPSQMQALRMLISTLAADPSKKAELAELIAKATQDVDQKLQQAKSETRPAEAIKELENQKSGIAFLAVLADPNVKADERVAKTEELIRQNKDPFMVAVDLYRLYLGVPNRQADAIQHLKRAYELKPDDPGVIEMLFRASISTLKDADGKEVVKPDWDLAQKLVKRAVEVSIDPSEGHYFQGQLLLAHVDLKDNFIQAEREFRESLKIFPSHSNAYAWLGRALLAQNRIEEARAALEQSIAQNPRNTMAAYMLAKIADSTGDAENKAKYLRVCRELNVSDAWIQQQSQIAADEADPKAGIARREEARKKDPKDLANLLSLSQLYQRSGDNEKAKQTLGACYELQPKNLQFVQSYVVILQGLTPPDFETAEAVLRKTLESFGPEEKDGKATAQLLLAAHMETLLARKLPEAPKYQAVEAAFLQAGQISNSPAVMNDIASHYRRAGDFTKCEEWMRKSITQAVADKDPRVEISARRALLELLLQVKDYSRSTDIQKEIEAYRAKFDDAFGLLAMAEYATMTGRETSAIQYVTQYINASSGADKAVGFFQRGSMNYRRGDWDLAISDLKDAKSLSAKAFNYQHRILLARCQQITGQVDQAIAELSSILKEDSTVIRAAEELYRVYMAGKRYDEAEAFVMPAYQRDPKSPRWIGLLAEVAAARGDQVRAIQRAAESVQNSNFAPQMVDSMLSTYLEFKQFDELVQYVNTKLPEANRADPLVQMRVTTALIGKGDLAKASEAYTGTLNHRGDIISQVLVVAAEMTKFVDKNVATKFMQDEAAKRPNDSFAALAAVFVQRSDGNDEKFASSLEQLLGKLPKDDPKATSLRIEALQGLATTLYKAKKFELSRKAYEQVLEVSPERSASRAVALNNLAYLLMEDLHEPAAALRYAEEAAKMAPGQTNVLDTLGWNLVLMGEYDRGIAVIRAAIYAASAQDLVQFSSVHYHAAIGLQKRSQQARQKGQNTQAEQDLAEAKLDCRRAHNLLTMIKSDGDGLLGKVVALAGELGLNLDEAAPKKPAEIKK